MWYKVKKIYVWDKLVRPAWWQPWANTYMYWELVSNANDTSWNNRNGTVNGTVTWNNWAVFNWSWQVSSPINSMPSNFTISCWTNKTQSSTSEQVLFAKWWSYYETDRFGMYYNNSWNLYVRQATASLNWTWLLVWNFGYNTWNNVVFTKTWTTITVYANGTQTNQFNYYSWGEVNNTYLGIWWWTSSQRNFSGTIKDFIVENKTRTADEVSKYYNWTKSNYGL